MQGAGFGDAGTGPARMIGDNVETSRLKRAEDGLVHRRPIHTEMSEVMIVEHQGHRSIRSAASSGGTGSVNGRVTATIGAARMPLLRSLLSRSAKATGDGRRAVAGAAL